MGYVIIALIFAILLIPEILWRIYARREWRRGIDNAKSKPYVCPNCGLRFYAPKGKMAFVGSDKALLKCPQCGKTDVCSRPYDLDEQ